MLTWDDLYAIARALYFQYQDIDLDQVSLSMIYEWVLGLGGFEDDPELVNDEILELIYREWFEEVNSL